MRPSVFLTMMFTVIFVFTAFAFIINDFGTYYPDVDVNKTWEGHFNYTQHLNRTGTQIGKEIQNISEEKGFINVLTGGGYAMAKAVVLAFGLFIESGQYAVYSITFFGKQLGIPAFATALAICVFIVLVIFGILTILRRWKT